MINDIFTIEGKKEMLEILNSTEEEQQKRIKKILLDFYNEFNFKYLIPLNTKGWKIGNDGKVSDSIIWEKVEIDEIPSYIKNDRGDILELPFINDKDEGCFNRFKVNKKPIDGYAGLSVWRDGLHIGSPYFAWSSSLKDFFENSRYQKISTSKKDEEKIECIYERIKIEIKRYLTEFSNKHMNKNYYDLLIKLKQKI